MLTTAELERERWLNTHVRPYTSLFNDGTMHVAEQYNTDLISGMLVTVPHVLQVHVQWLADTLETFSIHVVTPQCPPIFMGYHAPISQVLPALATQLQPEYRSLWLHNGIPNVALLIQQLNSDKLF